VVFVVQMEAMDSIAGEADRLDRHSEHDEHDGHSEHSDHDQNAADPEGTVVVGLSRYSDLLQPMMLVWRKGNISTTVSVL